MARPTLLAAVTAAVFSSAAPALAQVNTEALRADIDGRRFYFALQGSVAAHAGNSQGIEASGSAFAAATFGPHLVFVKGEADYTEYSGTPTISKAFAHARYDARLLYFLYGEVFVQVEANRFQRLALRQIDGLGLRFGIVERRNIAVFYGTSWMLDYERLDDQFVFGSGPAWFAQRWSNYVSATWRMSKRARISDTLYAQPRFNGFYDARIYNDASFVVDVDKRFSIKIECGVHYNTTPPLGVLPTDVDATTSLVLTL